MIELGKYRHFKGKEYEVVGVARDSETLAPTVVYRACYGDRELWVRPASMWEEIVFYHGKSTPRFLKISDETEEI